MDKTMNTTTIATHEVASDPADTRARFARAGMIAAVAAGAATTAVAALADSAGVSLELPRGDGKSIPVLAFAQVTIVAAVIGLGLARLLVQRSTRPAAWFTRITVALTLASLIPPVVVDANPSTKVLLVVTHLIAAAIVIPVVATRLER